MATGDLSYIKLPNADELTIKDPNAVQSVGGDNGAISTSGTTSVTVSHSTSAGYKHIPTNGDAGNILAYGGSSGTAKWASLATGLGQGYGTCDTKEATVAKVATLSGYDLVVGGIVAIKFTNKVPASATLSINSKTAKAIYYKGSAIVANVITAGMTASFLYDGNYYHLIAKDIDNNTTYTNAGLGQGYGTCTTAASTVAKAVTLSGYALTTGGIVSVKFSYDVPASATMNINSKGAKAIYYRGAAITASVIKAGDTATFIYSTYYHLISIDRDENTTYSIATQSEAGLMSADDKCLMYQLIALDNLSSVNISAPLYTRAQYSDVYSIYQRTVYVTKAQLGISDSNTIAAVKVTSDDSRVPGISAATIDNANNRIAVTFTENLNADIRVTFVVAYN